jgi:two-component system LytT family response regulator
VRAFEVAALDYLLKPVEPPRLMEALNRVAQEVGRRAIARDSPKLRGCSDADEGQDLLCLRVTSAARFVRLDAIVCILARDDYTEVALEDGSSELVSVTMRGWEERLPRDRFTRLHRSVIAACAAIERVERHGGHWKARVRGQSEPIAVSRAVARELLGRPRRV